MVEERAYWLAWSQISGIGPVSLKRLKDRFPKLADAWTASRSELAAVGGLGEKLISTVLQARSRINPEQLLEEHARKNPYFWTPADPDYPRLLLEIPSPPPILYYRGQIQLEENQGIKPMVGIVGTRHPSDHGQRWTRKISIALAQHGFTVVSGMAAGIDGEAHLACMEAGGRTLAVLGTGVDVIYPHSNDRVYEKIQQQGLLLSEYPAGTKPDRKNFPPRNRIIAGLCRAVLVMEAPLKSGSLITARYANEFGRDVYALPHSPENQQYEGCLRLLHDGAEMILAESELLQMLGAIPQIDRVQQLSLSFSESNIEKAKPTLAKPIPDLAPELAAVWNAISGESSFDGIVQNSSLTASDVSAALLQLELLGLVSQLPGMRYSRNNQ